MHVPGVGTSVSRWWYVNMQRRLTATSPTLKVVLGTRSAPAPAALTWHVTCQGHLWRLAEMGGDWVRRALKLCGNVCIILL